MATVNFKDNEFYQDYDAQYYFRSLGMENVRFTTKAVTVDDKQVVLVNVKGVLPDDGRILNTDLWPRNEATAEDLANLGSIDTFVFRVGYYTNPTTGEVTASAPKHLLCSGEKREFKA